MDPLINLHKYQPIVIRHKYYNDRLKILCVGKSDYFENSTPLFTKNG